ncbi:MAG: Mov34/MPN/PAD-1 family protein [Patescibacteria group bacterium]
MIPIWIKDNTTPHPETPFYYIIAQNGIFMYKENPFWQTVVPLNGISTLKSESPRFTFQLPKLTKQIVSSMVRFFASLSQKHDVETIVLLLWDAEKHKYALITPHQIVSSDTIERYEIPRFEYPIHLIGTFHSHSKYPAFHSKTDHRDESFMDGVHGTFGSFRGSTNTFTLSIQAVINNTRFDCDPMEILAGISLLSDKKSEYALLDSKRTIFPRSYIIPVTWYENVHTKKGPLYQRRTRRRGDNT